jgi:hypothetical protein
LNYFQKFDYIPNRITVKKEVFEREAQDLSIYVFNDFYDSEMFKAKHRIEDKNIICEL